MQNDLFILQTNPGYHSFLKTCKSWHDCEWLCFAGAATVVPNDDDLHEGTPDLSNLPDQTTQPSQSLEQNEGAYATSSIT